MSALQRGPNAGLSGIIAFPGSGEGQFRVKVYLASDTWDLNLIDDAGRGDGEWPNQIPGSSNGVVVVSGKITIKDWPNPASLSGATGTLTITYFTGKTATLSVRVFKRGVSFSEKAEETWDIKLTCQVLDNPVMAGWDGSQPDDSFDPPDDKVLWQGMQLVRDPNGLQDTAIYRLRVWGVTDDDASEIAELESHFADTSPIDDLKLRPLPLTRVSANVVYLNFTFAVKDTKQDIEFQSRKRTEATYLNPDQTVITVTDSSTPPTVIATGGTPGANEIANPDDVNLELVLQDSQQATNGGKWIHTSVFDKFNPANAMIEGFKEITSDPVGFMVADDKRLTINQSATPISPPAVTGMVCIRRLIKRIGKTQYGHFFWYAFRSTVDQMTSQRQLQSYDVSKIASTMTAAKLYTKGYDGAATAGTTGFTSATAGFVSGDAGKMITFRSPLVPNVFFNGTISAVTNSTTIVLSANSPLTATGIEFWYGPAFTAPLSEIDIAHSHEPLPMVGYSDYESPNPAYAIRVFRFARMTNERAIEYRGTSATASAATPQPVGGTINVQTLVDEFVPATYGDVGALAKAAQTTYANTAGFDSLAVSMLTPTLARTRITRINDDKLLIETGGYSRSERLGCLASGTSGAVYVDDAKQVGTGAYRVSLGTFQVEVAYQTVILRRRSTGVNNADDVRFLTVRGCTNDDTFLGYPAGTLKFVGVNQRTNWNLEGTNHTQAYDLLFQYRNIGWYDDRPFIVGKWYDTDTALEPGDTPPLNDIKSAWIANAATAVDFDPFLT